MLGRHAEAQASYRAALAQAPTGFAAANNLGLSLLLDGRPAEARAVLEPLARRPGAPPRVRVNLAVARAATGDEAGARDLLGEEAATLDLRSLRATLGGGGRGPVLEDAAAPPQGGR
jgi:Flp pilus assembly protein TadD